jgi:hypothetical protein
VPVAPTTSTTSTLAPVGQQGVFVGEIAPPFASKREQFSTLAGAVEIEVAWTGAPRLSVGLECGDAETSVTAGTGVRLQVEAPPGACDVVLQSPVRGATVNFEVAYTREVTPSHP